MGFLMCFLCCLRVTLFFSIQPSASLNFLTVRRIGLLTEAPQVSGLSLLGPPPFLLLSLVFNEEPEWLSFWLNVTHAAMNEMPYAVIISTSPRKLALAQQAAAKSSAAGFVGFTPPFDKKVKTNLNADLLRAHTENIAAALQNRHLSNFSYAMLLSSNCLFIRPVGHLGFKAAVLKPPVVLIDPQAKLRPDIPFPTEWFWPAVEKDTCLLSWVRHKYAVQDDAGKEGIAASQMEGLTASRRLWVRLVRLYWDYVRVCGNFTKPREYPEEEIWYATIVGMLTHGVGASSTGMGIEDALHVCRIHWEDEGYQPSLVELTQIQADSSGVLVSKRFPRDKSHNVTQKGACWAAEKVPLVRPC